MKDTLGVVTRQFADIESTENSDTITGTAADEVIDGGGGNDVIDGGAGLDTITGGLGDDVLYGGSYYDAIDGGDGNDFIVGDLYFSEPSDINDHYNMVTTPDSTDWIRGGAGDDTISALGADHEIIDLSRLDERFDDFDDLLLATEEVTPDTSHGFDYAFLITTGDGDSILLQGRGDVSLADIDFVL